MKTLSQRIKRRGRTFEQKIPRAYVASLETLYEDWFSKYNESETLVIETDRVDYIEHMFDRLEMISTIERFVRG